MTRAYGIVLITEIIDEDTIAPVNDWLHSKYPGTMFNDVTDGFGGYKCPSMRCFATTVNYLLEDEFIAFIRCVDWMSPEGVLLIIKSEELPPKVTTIEP